MEDVPGRRLTDILPKRLTLHDEISGKLGFNLDGSDINVVLSEIENSSAIDLNINLLKTLGKILRFTFGNQNHYKKIIRCYIKTLVHLPFKDFKSTIDEVSNTFVLYDISNFLRYLFLFELFIPQDKNGINKYSVLIRKNTEIEKVICDIIFSVLLLEGIPYKDIRSSKSLVNYIIDLELYKSDDLTENLLVDEDYWLNKLNNCKSDDFLWYHEFDEHLELITRLFPFSLKFNLFLADIYQTGWEYEKAVGRFQDYFNLESTDEKVNHFFNYAYCLYEKGDINESLKYYLLYIEKFDSSAAFNNRAIIYKELGEYEKSETDYLKAISIDPDDELYIKNLIIFYFDLEQNDKLLAVFDNYNLNSIDSDLLIYKAISLARLNKKNEAFEQVKQYCKIKNIDNEDDFNNELADVFKYLPSEPTN